VTSKELEKCGPEKTFRKTANPIAIAKKAKMNLAIWLCKNTPTKPKKIIVVG
jgi:hypothetical protein